MFQVTFLFLNTKLPGDAGNVTTLTSECSNVGDGRCDDIGHHNVGDDSGDALRDVCVGVIVPVFVFWLRVLHFVFVLS